MLRRLTRADLPRMIQIEQTVSVVPWDDEAFKMCFAAGYGGWGVEQGGFLIGFVIISVKAEECHILNLCVDRPAQRQGLARRLLVAALAEAKQTGALMAYLEVRRSNVGAIALYEQMNFTVVGERKGYYPTVAGSEDALVFALSL